MTKTEILKKCLKVIDLLEMDCLEYLEYRKNIDICEDYFSTDFYTVFGMLCDECISELSSIILGCNERFKIGDFAFMNGRFVVSNRVLDDDEYKNLRVNNRRYMLKYGKYDFSDSDLKRWGF